jgi:hypothetical protein
MEMLQNKNTYYLTETAKISLVSRQKTLEKGGEE